MWNKPYIKERWAKDIGDTMRDRCIVEALIALHRMRSERFVEGRRFYMLRNPLEDTDDEIAVEIGFTDDLSEQMIDRRGAWRVPDDTLAIVRSVIGV